MKYDELFLQLRYCGILLYPLEEDIIAIGANVKNPETQDRAVNDIVMACRKYAIRSHDLNKDINKDIILAKFKPNLEYDFKFFDDEEVLYIINIQKDWFQVGWYPNKCTIGNTAMDEGELLFTPTTETVYSTYLFIIQSRPHFHLLVQDMKLDDIYDAISDYKTSPGFVVNLRNFLRILGIGNLP